MRNQSSKLTVGILVITATMAAWLVFDIVTWARGPGRISEVAAQISDSAPSGETQEPPIEYASTAQAPWPTSATAHRAPPPQAATVKPKPPPVQKLGYEKIVEIQKAQVSALREQAAQPHAAEKDPSLSPERISRMEKEGAVNW